MDVRLWGAFLTAFAFCAVCGPFLIPFLRKLKFGQSIRDCGPKEHLKKTGTPTMGGLLIIAAILISTILWADFTPMMLVVLVLTVGHGVIGFIDDYIKVILKRNLGLTARQKFLMQFCLAGIYLLYVESTSNHDFLVQLPGSNTFFDLGLWYYPFALLLLVGTTNAVNLTDGLDGLVSFVTIPIALAYMLLAQWTGQSDLAIFALALAGACLGFLLFNHYPAKVFMGDTGSLAIGGGIAALALLTKTELLLVVIGIVYVLEALSVIIQVTYFRFSGGKRIFRMSPLHHHFELGGWHETKVVKVFSLISLLAACCGLLLFFVGRS
ncbi:MAG TPA: phospho-N-acetylmuramoyl-pentapeptide-transferase [Candidatus Avacidaminococcus intestinavium]|uniref:Phospho-N-acetylmuramoyl-pentapeptide-transferase n=1 Tax=Candidatus Avacidaminococcus intestinavium TaxID=2840684 RepID=A0A9D1MN12_9FIRM|nr:phospho-N-acetylmuramoyl-pentapeptide-transferase [Candidatus Avacidaminococcus intestinavium]